jgi:lysozyme
MIAPVVADLAHFNTINFAKVKAAGIHGVIHKATQGIGMTDPQYAQRRDLAMSTGVWWGAYSFATADAPKDHVAHFLNVAKPDAQTLMCLDFEDNPKSPMSGAQAYEFMERVEQDIGRMCWIYGGNRILEQITPLCQRSSATADYFAARPLWLCQYKNGLGDVTLEQLNAHIHVPGPWKDYTLLQYAADGSGPPPHNVDGLEPNADLNAFDGPIESLQALWPGPPIPQAAA